MTENVCVSLCVFVCRDHQFEMEGVGKELERGNHRIEGGNTGENDVIYFD